MSDDELVQSYGEDQHRRALRSVAKRVLADAGVEELRVQHHELLESVKSALALGESVTASKLGEIFAPVQKLVEADPETAQFDKKLRRFREARVHELEHKSRGAHYRAHMASQPGPDWFTDPFEVQIVVKSARERSTTENYTILREDEAYEVSRDGDGGTGVITRADTLQDAIMGVAYYLALGSE